MTTAELQMKAKRPQAVRGIGKFRGAELAKHVYVIVLCLLLLYPLVLLVQTSFKDTGQVMFEFFKIRAPFHTDNYARAWEQVSPMIINSFIMAGGSAILSVLVASMAGYAFSKLTFPGKEALFWVVFAKMLLPGVMNLVPSFVLAWKLGLLDSYWVVILFAVAGAQPFWVFVMRTFVTQQPQELFDCARIDGASEIRLFWHVACPLLRPMLTLTAINVFIGVWNDYIWPLVTIPTFDKRPLTVGLTYLTSGYPGDYGPLTAGYVIASIPLLVIFLIGMKQFVKGLTGGAIKL